MAPATWNFVVSLAAVINGLGIVRLVGGFGDFLKRRNRLQVTHYWVYSLMAIFQLLAHILLWWSIVGLQSAGNINFLTYLYLLIGPTLLFLATTMLLPTVTDNKVDLHSEYFEFRQTYYLSLLLFWIWALLLWPAFGYPISPTWPFIGAWLVISAVLTVSENKQAHALLVPANLLIFVAIVGMFGMQLGGVARQITG